MGKKITKEQFEERMKQSHPFSQVEIVYFTGLKEPMEYKCLRCGKVYSLNAAEGIFSRLNPCDCKKEFNSRKDKIKYFEGLQQDLEVLEIGRTKSKIQCKKCGQIFERTTVSLMANFDNCPYCNNFYHKQTSSKSQAEERLKIIFPNTEYEVLAYTSFHGYSEIKHHECNFVYKGNFDSFLQSRGCPRCYRKKSKGEQRIENFLRQQNIDFIYQKSLNLEDGKFSRFKFDFFIPSLNLAIEYNGEQHYKEKAGYFDSLNKTQKRDKIKSDYCKRNNIILLSIPYWEYDNIESILISKLNDYRNIGGVDRPKQVETDNFEDIVCSYAKV